MWPIGPQKRTPLPPNKSNDIRTGPSQLFAFLSECLFLVGIYGMLLVIWRDVKPLLVVWSPNHLACT